MAELNIETVIKSGVEKALNKPIVDGKSITEWAAIGMKAPRWVSVRDRLPETGMQCLVFTPFEARKRSVETATYTEFGWMTAAYFPAITHWMPIPEPPKEVSGDADGT